MKEKPGSNVLCFTAKIDVAAMVTDSAEDKPDRQHDLLCSHDASNQDDDLEITEQKSRDKLKSAYMVAGCKTVWLQGFPLFCCGNVRIILSSSG